VKVALRLDAAVIWQMGPSNPGALISIEFLDCRTGWKFASRFHIELILLDPRLFENLVDNCLVEININIFVVVVLLFDDVRIGIDSGSEPPPRIAIGSL
jgi:hypothetical protein